MKQKITYHDKIKHLSDCKLKQMFFSYKDWCKKHNYNLVNMNMFYPLKYKIQIVVDEYYRRNNGKKENSL